MNGPRIRATPKAHRKAEPFLITGALAFAADALTRDPPAWITRPTPRGELLYRFALPLSCCPTGNMMRHAPGWRMGKWKGQAMALMSAQLRSRPTCPLQWRPQVLAVRFSSVEADSYADWAKIPIDCLKKLGLIVDDSPRCIELHQWSEKASPKSGCVLLEVWSGA